MNFKQEVLKVFNKVIKDYYADALLLSGGLDTSIIAYSATQYFKPYAITVAFTNKAPDLKYARIIANHLKLQNFIKVFNLKEAVKAAAQVIKIVKSFDPMEVRNDIPLYMALKHAKKYGLKSVITGDGGDELFAGYPFLFKLKSYEVDKWIKNVINHWFFAAKPIGENLKIKVLQPFLDERIIKLALKIPSKLKITKRKGVTYGKYILRKAFENLLPAEIIWRDKNPIEVGSESIKLSEIFQATQEEFNELSKIVKLNSLEQAYYFKIYLKEVGEIPKPKNREKQCLKCGGGVPVNRNYCKICGAYPI
ncbi:asparagine synthase [Candidatus Bathyarchaeota archaeon]|nr:asparagine synthase [Candidatus Bathyarchaeota archaeon]